MINFSWLLNDAKACDDTPNWKSGRNGPGCDFYRAKRMCVDGKIFYTEEYSGSVTHKMMFEGDYNYPEQNCCGCGRIQGGKEKYG